MGRGEGEEEGEGEGEGEGEHLLLVECSDLGCEFLVLLLDRDGLLVTLRAFSFNLCQFRFETCVLFFSRGEVRPVWPDWACALVSKDKEEDAGSGKPLFLNERFYGDRNMGLPRATLAPRPGQRKQCYLVCSDLS